MATPSSCHMPHPSPDAHVAAWPIHKSALKAAAAEHDKERGRERDREWDRESDRQQDKGHGQPVPRLKSLPPGGEEGWGVA